MLPPISLISKKNGTEASYLQAGFDDAGDLVLEGQDLGSSVEAIFGDSDYEYWLTVPLAALPRLVEELVRELGEPAPTAENQQIFILTALKRLFTPDQAPLHFVSDSEFRKWLKTHRIPNQLTTY
jgi:hypothetical protein